jgi:hypothetical protein
MSQATLEIGDTLVKLTGDPEDPEIASVWQVLDVHSMGDVTKLVTITEVNPQQDDNNSDQEVH